MQDKLYGKERQIWELLAHRYTLKAYILHLALFLAQASLSMNICQMHECKGLR